MKAKIYQMKVYADGTVVWTHKKKRHREDGPAITYPDGTEEYWIDGKQHRENGPAVIRPDGTELYFRNGQLHRENGPAIKHSDGSEAYWLDHKEYSKEEFYKELANRQQKALACETKEVMIDGVKYKLVKA